MNTEQQTLWFTITLSCNNHSAFSLSLLVHLLTRRTTISWFSANDCWSVNCPVCVCRRSCWCTHQYRVLHWVHCGGNWGVQTPENLHPSTESFVSRGHISKLLRKILGRFPILGKSYKNIWQSTNLKLRNNNAVIVVINTFIFVLCWMLLLCNAKSWNSKSSEIMFR